MEKTDVEELSYIIGGLEGVLDQRECIDKYVGILDEKQYNKGYEDSNKVSDEPMMFDYFKDKPKELVEEELNKVCYPFDKVLNGEMIIENGMFKDK